MSLDLPKLRSDLTIREQPAAGGSVLVIKNPVTGAYFRLGSVERFIAEQCDGRTPPEVIRRRAQDTLGGSVPAGAFRRFLGSLEKAGLLESGASTRVRRRSLRGSWLYLRFRIFNPDRLLGRLEPPARLLFTRGFLALSALSILLAAVVGIANWNAVQADFFRVYRLSGIPLVLLTILAVVAVHEVAHGLTCKHFGGEVPEMGFLLLYFQPALYCNVSDAWLFPEKSKRLWVAFAGPYFELFVWSLATLGWRATEPGTWVNALGYIVMTSSGIKTLLNLNPLLKMDGYYLLSDYLEIENLRRRAFGYIGGAIKRLLGSVATRVSDLTRRERRIFVGYGLTASVYSFSLLGLAVGKLGGYLAGHHRPLAVACVAAMVGAKTWRRLLRLFGGSSAGRDDDDPDDAEDPASDPAETSEPPADETPAERTRARRWKLVAAAGLIGVTAFLGRLRLNVPGEVNVLPLQNADVRAEVQGIVEEVLVDEGNLVHAGDLVARLSDRDLRTELRKTDAEIEQSRARLRLLETGPTKEEIDVSKTAAARAQDHVPYAQSRLAMNRELFKQGLVSRKDVEQTEEDLVTAQHDLAEARGKLDVLESGSRPEEIEATRADVTRLTAQRENLEAELGLLNVTSPITGIVATPAEQLHEMKHRLIDKGELIAKVYDYRAVIAQIAVSEQDIADVHTGQPVLIKVRAYPGETFRGTVTAIATGTEDRSAPEGPGASGGASSNSAPTAPRTILVTTRIDNSSRLLKEGMTGHAKIACGRRRIVDLVTRRLARTLRLEFWSWA